MLHSLFRICTTALIVALTKDRVLPPLGFGANPWALLGYCFIVHIPVTLFFRYGIKKVEAPREAE